MTSISSSELRTALVPPESMILEHSGGVDVDTWLKLGDYTVRDMFIEVAKLTPSSTVLDVGCGCAKIARPLVDYLTADGRYIGIDIGRDCINWCQSAYREHSNFEFHHVDLFSSRYNPKGSTRAETYSFPVETATVDMVFLGSVFTHLEPAATKNYLREISRVLKPKAQTIATFFLIDDVSRANLDLGSANPSLPYRLPDDSGCRVGSLEVPEAAIAYEEEYVRRAYVEAGLELFHVSRGHWAREPIVPHWQDDVWARKLA